jgi:WhiB family transcriptional regulator, redox-sensing transcriptional regulator
VALTMMSRPASAWVELGACREPSVDPELFFPVSDSGPAARQIAAAKAICAACPVVAQCRDWAVQAGEPAGIWGGTTPEERRLARSSAQPAPGHPLAGAHTAGVRSGDLLDWERAAAG